VTWGAAGLVVRFGSATALDGVDLTIAPGRIHAVIGGDGSGKSTLLRVLAGVLAADEGEVHRPAAGRVGFVSAGGGLFRDLTVDENVEFVAQAYRLSHWRPRAGDLLRRAGLDAFRNRLAGHLSGGQQRKLAGSLALLPEPDVLILDEVTTGVDPYSRMELWRLVASAAAAGAAVTAATAYLDEAERAEHVVLLHRGRVLASGPPQRIAEDVPGSVDDTDKPDDPARAWRHGARWRQWRPEAAPGRAGRMRLEDAAIVHELLAESAAEP
jgi:ABC-2 type transport system ATP-binding protein